MSKTKNIIIILTILILIILLSILFINSKNKDNKSSWQTEYLNNIYVENKTQKIEKVEKIGTEEYLNLLENIIKSKDYSSEPLLIENEYGSVYAYGDVAYISTYDNVKGSEKVYLYRNYNQDSVKYLETHFTKNAGTIPGISVVSDGIISVTVSSGGDFGSYGSSKKIIDVRNNKFIDVDFSLTGLDLEISISENPDNIIKIKSITEGYCNANFGKSSDNIKFDGFNITQQEVLIDRIKINDPIDLKCEDGMSYEAAVSDLYVDFEKTTFNYSINYWSNDGSTRDELVNMPVTLFFREAKFE